MKRNFLIVATLSMMIFLTGSSVLNAEVQFKGLVQTWFSYTPQQGSDNNLYGFTLRRLRLNPYGTLTKNIKWGFQVAWDKQVASVLDVYLDFLFSPQFTIRVGQFPAPGAISSALTSSGKLDMLERPLVTENWGGISRLSSFRAFGLQVSGELAKGKLYYAVMAANPKATSLFDPAIKATTYTHADNGLVLWTRLEAKPLDGLKIGAFASAGKDDLDYTTNSYGGHLFYEKNGLNFKAEYLAGKYGGKDAERKYHGYSILLGYTIAKLEPVVRYDFYTPNDNKIFHSDVKKFNHLTLGLNYFVDKNVKLQANYVLRDETMAAGLAKLDNNLFYICLQYTYN